MFTATVAGQLAKSIQYIKPVQPASDQGFVAELYCQMQTDFMAGPVLTLHSPAPEVMGGVWSILRESLLAGAVDRASKEAVAATVSKVNECPFCVDAHTALLHATGDHDVVRAILRGETTSIRDPHLQSLVQWLLASRVAPTVERPTPPFSQAEAPEILGTAFTFHYINRMVNVFLGDSLLPLPPALMGVTRRLMGATVGKGMVRPLRAGSSLKFVPQAPLPDEFSWALPSQTVTRALAGFARVVEEGGQAALSESVRRLVQEYVQAWQGETMGISRRWIEDAVVGLEKSDQAAARLALLTALASYQVDASIIADFQSYEPDDGQFIRATAWASFAAARRALSWLATPFTVKEGEQ
jgi:AhpD family alkylhydroperoxidase